MKHLFDWRPRLTRAMAGLTQVPHAWGSNDCLVGLADAAIEAVTGRAIFDRLVGRYADAPGALRVLAEEGAHGLDELVGRYLPPLPIGEMRQGDLAGIPDPSTFHIAIGVCIGERIVVLTPAGRGTVDRSQAVMAFRVGE